MADSTGGILLAGAVGALLGKMLGPVWGPAVAAILGPMLLITFGAVAGSLLAMSKAETPTRWSAARFILVGILVALAITSAVAWALERYLGVPTYVALMPVAAVIAAGRTALLTLMDKLIDLAAALLGAAARMKGGGQ